MGRLQNVLQDIPPHSSSSSTIHPHPPRQAVQPVASIQATLTLLFSLHHPGITPPHPPSRPNTTTGLRDMGQDVWQAQFHRTKTHNNIMGYLGVHYGEQKMVLQAQLNSREGVEGVVWWWRQDSVIPANHPICTSPLPSHPVNPWAWSISAIVNSKLTISSLWGSSKIRETYCRRGGQQDGTSSRWRSLFNGSHF